MSLKSNERELVSAVSMATLVLGARVCLFPSSTPAVEASKAAFFLPVRIIRQTSDKSVGGGDQGSLGSFKYEQTCGLLPE